jgi:hypothetical protein
LFYSPFKQDVGNKDIFLISLNTSITVYALSERFAFQASGGAGT